MVSLAILFWLEQVFSEVWATRASPLRLWVRQSSPASDLPT
jgi:hypothetical protein